jgi:hypothetical protein
MSPRFGVVPKLSQHAAKVIIIKRFKSQSMLRHDKLERSSLFFAIFLPFLPAAATVALKP